MYFLTCDDCFVPNSSGRHAPANARLIYTADHLIHGLDFEDDHVVQMACEARYLLGDVVKFKEAQGWRQALVPFAAMLLSCVVILLIGLFIGLSWGQAAERDAWESRTAVAQQGN